MTRALFAAVLSLWLTTSALAGFDEGLAAFERGDYATAVEEWLPIAEQGHADTQFALGVLYENGKGVPQDYVEAVKWYHLAAEQGNASAQANLGLMYVDSQGVAQDRPTPRTTSASTSRASVWRCPSLSLEGRPVALPSISPSGPRALKRNTQSLIT